MYIEPGSLEWHARRNRLLADEASQPEQWWYLSFATKEKGWLGAVIVKARGMTTAIQLSHRMGINPGGEVGAQLCPVDPPAAAQYRLLDKADLDLYFGGHNG